MKKFTFALFFVAAFIINSNAQKLPSPDHIVLVIFENQSYSGIIGSSSAPYINSLLKDSNTASLTQDYANSSAASQPNYFYLFAGSDQGVTSNTISSKTPFTTCNLGASLIAAGKTFKEYSEGLPSVGYLGTSYGQYDRKHNPSSDWQGTGSNTIPASCNQPYSSFPTNYDSLPTISFVVPDELDNMHTGSIQQGDNWLKNNMDKYITWAKAHNSLLIFTFDEDDGSANEHIATLFIGQMVKGGTYSEKISHLNLLRTMEDIYGLSACGGSSSASSITDIWKTVSGIGDNQKGIEKINIWPVPVRDIVNIDISANLADNANITITDITGRKMKEEKISIIPGRNNFHVSLHGFTHGIYILKVSDNEINFSKKIIVQ